MTTSFLVTGGTGTLGRLVVRALRDAQCSVRVLSRQAHRPDSGVEFMTGDLATSDGLDRAVAGIGTVVHCAGSATGDETKARHLVRAAQQAEVGHLVYISVVGAERVPVVSGIDRAMFGYFASKLAAETEIAESGIPWTTLRATQFHDAMLAMARQLARMPVVAVPAGFRFQPVDTAEVAARLVELALGPPAGLVPDLAGPEVYEVAELVRGYLRAAHRRRLVLPMRLPGRAARAHRAGANLSPDRAVGHRTWEDFLAEKLPTAIAA